MALSSGSRNGSVTVTEKSALNAFVFLRAFYLAIGCGPPGVMAPSYMQNVVMARKKLQSEEIIAKLS